MILNFSKYHGAGNDFILIDNRLNHFSCNQEKIAFLCDRHFGIGADGLMLLENHQDYDFTMRYFNSDGLEATLCGNGGRCIVAFAHQLKIVGEHLKFMAADGPHSAKIEKGQTEFYVHLQMKEIDLSVVDSNFTFLNTGSPHHIEWLDSVEHIDVVKNGADIRYSDVYTKIGGTNVNFIEVVNDSKIKIRTYERGVEAETLACGTGSTAAAILFGYKSGLTKAQILVSAIGGELLVSYQIVNNMAKEVVLSGPARYVFSGTIEI